MLPPKHGSIVALLAELRLYYKDAHRWRLTLRIPGEINALPQSAGVLVATNGILCLIDRGDREVFEGHLEWFVPDDMRARGELVKLKETAAEKPSLAVEDLVKELML